MVTFGCFVIFSLVISDNKTYPVCVICIIIEIVLLLYTHCSYKKIQSASIGHVVLRGGVLVEFQGGIFFMNFELLTFLCRQMIKLSIHVWHDSKINP